MAMPRNTFPNVTIEQVNELRDYKLLLASINESNEKLTQLIQIVDNNQAKTTAAIESFKAGKISSYALLTEASSNLTQDQGNITNLNLSFSGMRGKLKELIEKCPNCAAQDQATIKGLSTTSTTLGQNIKLLIETSKSQGSICKEVIAATKSAQATQNANGYVPSNNFRK